jgi:hypothetical protein
MRNEGIMMIKKKMTLSLVAMIGASLLFVVATFAWLTVSEFVDSGIVIVDVTNAETATTLQMSTDGGQNYVTTSSIVFENAVPGEVYYYRLMIENTGEVPLSTSVFLQGFTDSVASILGDPTNYNNGQTLRDILILDSYNTGNTDTVVATTITTGIGTLPVGVDYDQGIMSLADDIPIAVSATETVYFTITVSEDAGNDFTNLQLTVNMIQISSVDNAG